MSDPIVIKTILISAFVVMAVLLFLPRSGDRPLALRRLTVGVLLLLAILAVAFPELTTSVANALGVGRGVDLLVYGLVVMFIYHSIHSKSRFAKVDQRATELARKLAILEAEPAGPAGARLVQAADQRTEPGSAAGGDPVEG